MTKLAALVLALAAGTGCYASAGGYGSTGYYGGTSTGYASGSVTYSTPPPAYTDVDVYYEERPGYVYINGRHNWVNNQWIWQPGYYETERANQVYIQGYWNNNQWIDGRWEGQRPGYVYTGGYWDTRGTGRVWINGSWDRDRGGDNVYVRGSWTNNNGVRTYNRGGWSNRARVNTNNGSPIRDHRRR